MNKLEQALVVITTAPTLEEPLIDWLLAREHQAGFTSMPVFGHSSRQDHLTSAEQVSGRQHRLQFQIQLALASAESFVREMRKEFEGADLHYWIQPVYTPSE